MRTARVNNTRSLFQAVQHSLVTPPLQPAAIYMDGSRKALEARPLRCVRCVRPFHSRHRHCSSSTSATITIAQPTVSSLARIPSAKRAVVAAAAAGYLSIKNWSAATTLSSAVSDRYGAGPRSFGATFWNPGVETEKTAKKRRKNEQKWARYSHLKRVRVADLFVMDRYQYGSPYTWNRHGGGYAGTLSFITQNATGGGKSAYDRPGLSSDFCASSFSGLVASRGEQLPRGLRHG